jgi:hypothetical protein
MSTKADIFYKVGFCGLSQSAGRRHFLSPGYGRFEMRSEAASLFAAPAPRAPRRAEPDSHVQRASRVHVHPRSAPARGPIPGIADRLEHFKNIVKGGSLPLRAIRVHAPVTGGSAARQDRVIARRAWNEFHPRLLQSPADKHILHLERIR